jgi:3-hydroxyisobutyrate dehydrogenase
MKIGVIGCGNMGGGMARQLVRGGFEVICFDPNETTLGAMHKLGAATAETASALARDVQCLILSLPKAEIVSAVMNEIAAVLPQGAIVLDTSTSEPATSQASSTLGAKHGFAFIDGPVSGGPTAANAGTMTMLLGGDQTAIASVRPVLDVITAKTVIVGGSGAGHAAKIANNMLCAANLVLVAEAVRIGEAAGVKPADLLEGINAGSGRSGVSEVNFPKWVLDGSYNSGFTMGLMRKDVRLALDLALSQGISLAGFQGVADVWLTGSDTIPDDADFNEIVKAGQEEHDDD